jgi:tetratricopeptide (TPR) repeat protein
MNDAAGHALSGSNAQGLEQLERALREFSCLAGDPLAAADAALAAAPELVMAHVLRAWLLLSGADARALPQARESLARAERLPHDAREAGHLRAIACFCAGRWRAAALALEDLSIEHPLDLPALQIGHQIDFLTGDTRMLRDRIARALPAWSHGMPGYHAVLGMYAFGLEENGDYARAERLGRRAVELEPADGWAQHAVAHVFEMQGRRDEGIVWMRGNPGWRQGSLVGVHNGWHLALHHLAQGDFGAALALHDGPIAGHCPAVLADLVDASALLWRLELAGAEVGGRWTALAGRWAAMAGRGGYYAFDDFHAAMAYARAGRADLLQALHEAQAAALRSGTDNADFTREVGLPATAAVTAYAAGDPRRAVELLRPMRSRAHRFGGSHAQRDLIELTLIAAARASGQASLARALEVEREVLAAQRQPAATARRQN